MQKLEDCGSIGAEACDFGFAGLPARDHPLGFFAYEEGDGSDARGDNTAFRVGDGFERRWMGREASPAYCARKAKLVQNRWIEIGDAAFEDLSFPGISGGFITLKLTNRFEGAALAEKLRAWNDVLPAKQPVHELGGSYGLDLLAEPAEREFVNAGEQAALAPFGFMGGWIGELAAEDDAARLQAEERFVDV